MRKYAIAIPYEAPIQSLATPLQVPQHRKPPRRFVRDRYPAGNIPAVELPEVHQPDLRPTNLTTT